METKFAFKKLTTFLSKGMIFGFSSILIIGVAYAFSTWNPRQPPQANPADGNVKIGCDSLTGITYAAGFTTWSAEQPPLATPANGNTKVTCSPYLAGGESIHTEEDCMNTGGNVETAGSVKLCSFKPGIGGNTCTDLNCNTNFAPSSIRTYHFAEHPRYWSCPSGWNRYKNWGKYSTTGCWVTQEGWYNSGSDSCGMGWTTCLRWLTSCTAGNIYGGVSVIFPWSENNNKNGYYVQHGPYGGAMCPSGTNLHYSFAMMEDIGCY
ncbi:MAG: hypothetical protein PHO48_00935 [Candidatus Gracilibacteria bacterium]|nr:hypothetical protein [Candidatus Gracilibacteria bacterium]